MKNLSIVIIGILISTQAMSAVVRGFDFENNCNLFRVVPVDESGKIVKGDDEIVINSQDTYGLSFIDMEVNFNQREVTVKPIMNIVFGINRQLVNGKVSIEEKNPDFNFLINQLNRKVFLFEKMCITDDNKVIYAKYFENKENQTASK